LESENDNVRSKSAWALGEIGDERAILPLIEHLGDENATTRWKTAVALSKFGKKSLIPLMDALKYEDAIVREKAAESLGEIGDPDSLDVLKIAMEDDDVYVRKSAEESIKRIIRKIS
jgi:HEAT repeat protein